MSWGEDVVSVKKTKVYLDNEQFFLFKKTATASKKKDVRKHS